MHAFKLCKSALEETRGRKDDTKMCTNQYNNESMRNKILHTTMRFSASQPDWNAIFKREKIVQHFIYTKNIFLHLSLSLRTYKRLKSYDKNWNIFIYVIK